MRNLKESRGWTVGQAMKMLGISEGEQPIYEEKLKKEQERGSYL